MLTLTALLASLPPSSLAETDLARFAAQALGRRARAELPGLAALLGEETLRGYAPSLGKILQALVETMIQAGVDPQVLDARTADGLLGSASFVARLEAKVSVGRQRLRPGTILSSALRQRLGMRLLVLPGVGRELALIAPVDLAQVPDAHFAVPLGVVLARPAPPEEAEVLRASWAVIEERFGLDGAEAKRWGERFLAISRLENHDAQAAAEGLERLAREQRTTLWEALVAHLRDQELPEQHRSGRRGLERRLGELGLGFSAPPIPAWVEATLTLVESVYRAAGLDPEVMAGRCHAPREDVERWAGWVDVAAAGREQVRVLSCEAIEAALVRLAEEEAGRIERSPEAMPEPLARALASLRDGCLRPRWQRSRWALVGIDPLELARARIASGEDTHALRQRLEALAQEAARTERAAPPAPARVERAPAGEPAPEVPASEAPAPSPALVEVPEASEPYDARGLRPSRFFLPPMPSVPPPRPAPRVRPRTDFPPMPSPPPPKAPPERRPATEPRLPAALEPSARSGREPTARIVRETEARIAREPSARIVRPPSARVAPQKVPTERLEPAGPRPKTITEAPAAPRTARPRTGTTAPHLVTPAQGNDFYDASFRELELIERDLLQRGPYAGAAERVQAITAEAAELHAALGPSARSGDREFQAAQRRIEKVQEYLERIRPLLTSTPLPTPLHGEGERRRGLFGRLFGKRSE